MKKFLKPLILLIACAVFIGCFILAPIFIEILLILNFGLLLALGISRLVLAGHKKPEDPLSQEPVLAHKVSVHLPISQESPKVVCNTIRSIINQKYRNLEVIVLCNHTPDDTLWRPVQVFCNHLGPRVKFRKVKTVKGHKAGALAMCRKFTDPGANYIFTLDADYLLHHHAISYAVTQMENVDIDLMQFPRAYVNSDESTEGLLQEFGHYFNCYSSGANTFGSCLPTGTLTFIKKKVLDDIGGWSDSSITEESELGIALLEKGYKPYFCNKQIGWGVMPNTNEKINAQRSQWIFGNFQSLPRLLRAKSISFKSKWASTVQLTAWLNMLALPYLTILLATLTILATGRVFDHLLLIAIISILAHMIFQYFIFGISTRFKLIEHHLGFFINMNMGPLGAFYWWSYFFNSKKPFGMTNGFGKILSHRLCGALFAILLMGCALVIGQNYSYLLGFVVASYAALGFTAKLLLATEFTNSDGIIKDTLYTVQGNKNFGKT